MNCFPQLHAVRGYQYPWGDRRIRKSFFNPESCWVAASGGHLCTVIVLFPAWKKLVSFLVPVGIATSQIFINLLTTTSSPLDKFPPNGLPLNCLLNMLVLSNKRFSSIAKQLQSFLNCMVTLLALLHLVSKKNRIYKM